MGDTSQRIAGTVFLAVDGQSFALVGDFYYDPSIVERETATGLDGVHGYIEKPHPAEISATLRDAGSLTVADFNAMTNVTLTVELANGKTIIGRNMWSVEAQKVKADDSTFEVKWQGLQGAVSEN